MTILYELKSKIMKVQLLETTDLSNAGPQSESQSSSSSSSFYTRDFVCKNGKRFLPRICYHVWFTMVLSCFLPSFLYFSLLTCMDGALGILSFLAILHYNFWVLLEEFPGSPQLLQLLPCPCWDQRFLWSGARSYRFTFLSFGTTWNSRLKPSGQPLNVS